MAIAKKKKRVNVSFQFWFFFLLPTMSDVEWVALLNCWTVNICWMYLCVRDHGYRSKYAHTQRTREVKVCQSDLGRKKNRWFDIIEKWTTSYAIFSFGPKRFPIMLLLPINWFYFIIRSKEVMVWLRFKFDEANKPQTPRTPAFFLVAVVIPFMACYFFFFSSSDILEI